MVRVSTSVLAIACTLATASAAHAGSSWSFGFSVAGPPVYYGPPPVYYEPPVVYEPGPPVLHEEPVVVAPPVRARERSPDEIFDWLEAAGYREFGPMAHRDPLYKLNAVNPEGDLVGARNLRLYGRHRARDDPAGAARGAFARLATARRRNLRGAGGSAASTGDLRRAGRPAALYAADAVGAGRRRRPARRLLSVQRATFDVAMLAPALSRKGRGAFRRIALHSSPS